MKTLALITSSESTKNELCSQLRFLLEDYMDVVGYATETGISEKVKADLVVMSSTMMAEQAKDLASPECPVIVANRSLNLQSLERLFSIPKGTEVVLVNDELENSQEVIKLLQDVGIDYLRYVPYAPNHPLTSKSTIAITPGETSLVPSSIHTIIDIGPRVIDLTTIIEILSLLGLLDEQSRLISTRYLETIIRLNKKLHDSMEEAGKVNLYLNRVLNQVNEGILTFSDEGIISVCNESAALLFGKKGSSLIGLELKSLVKDHNVLEFLLTRKDQSEGTEQGEGQDQIFHINQTEVIINRFHSDMLRSTVCTIKDTKEAIDLEKKLRQNLVSRGFIGKYHFHDIVCASAKMQQLVEIATRLADSDLGILIYGESGVGKELFASSIHNVSKRKSGPFLAVNFSALPEDLVESELFGYEEGSFTGARKGGQRGLFEQANGGTIFLDEIGDISPKIQTRLLRVLQEKEIRRVGGTQILPIDVRVIAATNHDLAKMCREGFFREDLYHRLKKLYLKIPPLRQRREDIDPLISHFLMKNGRTDLELSQEVLSALRSHPWRGNVRELENVIEYFIAVCKENQCTLDQMPQDFLETNHELEIDAKCFEHATPAEFSETAFRYYITDDTTGTKGEYDALLIAIEQYNRMGQAASRSKLLESCSATLPYLTEDRIRRKTDRLKEKGLIFKSAGKAGMRLTPKGVDYLRTMK